MCCAIRPATKSRHSFPAYNGAYQKGGCEAALFVWALLRLVLLLGAAERDEDSREGAMKA